MQFRRNETSFSLKHRAKLLRPQLFSYLLDGRHPDLLVVVQRGVGGAHVVTKSSHSHFVTVMKGHRYGNCPQGGNILENTDRGQCVL